MPKKPPNDAPPRLERPALTAGSAVVVVIGIGTFSFHALEDWTWIQSFYFCVVTLATVGYGDFTPTSDASRLFAAIYILLSAGIVVTALGVIGSRYLELRQRRQMKRREKSAENTSALKKHSSPAGDNAEKSHAVDPE
ncbi:MAG: two pore domain potassium channel family protein [Thermoleophilia bacterium]|nr:two pore domain potassium channel family protein [Thermoleophilia bacterium]